VRNARKASVSEVISGSSANNKLKVRSDNFRFARDTPKIELPARRLVSSVVLDV